MPKFTLTNNRFSRHLVQFKNLVIDGEDQFEKFEESLEEKYRSQFRSLSTYIHLLSDKRQIGHNKLKKIQGIDNTWELKTVQLRLYYIVLKEYGTIICLGGMKKGQKGDIKRVKSLHEQLLTQIEETGLENLDKDIEK